MPQLLLPNLFQNMTDELVVLDVVLRDVPVFFEDGCRKVLVLESDSYRAVGILDNENLLAA